jgi:nuclear transport factor 2 (NTF2) superfamily protein
LIKPRDPEAVAKAYTPDSIWRNRTSFLRGRDEIVKFLTAKWKRERSYRLRKELFSFTDNRIAVQFWYEYQDAENGDKWTRCYGLEDWTFDKEGKMEKRMMSGNDLILGSDGDGVGRWFVDGVDVNDVEIGPEHW